MFSFVCAQYAQIGVHLSMKLLKLIINCCVCSLLLTACNQDITVGAPLEIDGEHFDSEVDNTLLSIEDNINEFVRHILSDDADLIASQIEYPLHRRSPLDPIENETEFVKRFDVLFDDIIKQQLRNHLNKPLFIDEQEENGTIGILNGQFWFNSDIHLVMYDYTSEQELLALDQRELKIRTEIHPILKDYQRNIYLGRTERYLVRVDQMMATLRLAVWEGKQTMRDEPDFILNNGTTKKRVSEGGYITQFESAKKIYFLDQLNRLEDTAKGRDFFRISENQKAIYDEQITPILDPFEALN